MDILDYQDMHRSLTEQLHDLKDQRAETEATLGDLSKQIQSLEITIKHIGLLAGYVEESSDNSLAGIGITDAVRHVLDLKERFSVAEIRTRMEARGFDFSGYSAPNSSISTTLRRLVEAGKAEMEKVGWKTFYKYRPTDAEMPF